jgi:hypothetical protein
MVLQLALDSQQAHAFSQLLPMTADTSRILFEGRISTSEPPTRRAILTWLQVSGGRHLGLKPILKRSAYYMTMSTRSVWSRPTQEGQTDLAIPSHIMTIVNDASDSFKHVFCCQLLQRKYEQRARGMG